MEEKTSYSNMLFAAVEAAYANMSVHNAQGNFFLPDVLLTISVFS